MTDLVLGFDGSADCDTSLVVMSRSVDGTWQIEHTDGPDAVDLARMAGAVFAEHLPPPQRETAPWFEWLADHEGRLGLELEQWQRRVVTDAYTALIRDGKLRHLP